MKNVFIEENGAYSIGITEGRRNERYKGMEKEHGTQGEIKDGNVESVAWLPQAQ